jgi:hypothetical protein
VLVPDQVPLSYVDRVVFVSEASRGEGERLWGTSVHPPFEVAPEHFVDIPMDPMTINFSYLDRLLLTSQPVTAATVERVRTHQTRFRRTATGVITLVASVQALAGAKARVRWDPIGRETVDEFEALNRYWHWPHVPMSVLPDGPSAVRYYLNGVLWGQIDFELATA